MTEMIAARRSGSLFLNEASNNICLVPRLDTDPDIIRFAQGLLGRTLLVTVMTVLSLCCYVNPLIVIGAACAAYLPRFRMMIVSILTVAAILAFPSWDTSYPAWIDASALSPRAMVIGIIVLTLGGATLASRFGRRGPFARPVLSLLGLLVSITLLASAAIFDVSTQAMFWQIAIGLGAYIWFIAYAWINASGRHPLPVWHHLAGLHPFWGSSATPFGKGAAYFQKFEAKTQEELAITQLKAVKLLLWAFILREVYFLFAHISHQMMAIPDLAQAISEDANGKDLPFAIRWLSLVVTFADHILELSVSGHIIVACCRFAGFRIPRNTYRPLEAATISEFWNRYYFYFKELLVEMFFFPTFSRWFREHMKIRIAFATFMAAGVGNFIFHFFRDINVAARTGLIHDLLYSQTYAFYCLLLPTGICVSQLHRVSGGGRSTGWVKVMFGRSRVILFYLLLSVFADDDRTYTLYQHIIFFMRLFGVHLT